MTTLDIGVVRGQTDPEARLTASWSPHPVLAAVVGVAWHLSHFGVSVAATITTAQLVDRPSGWQAQGAWFVLLASVATVALLVSERLFRRLVTLRTLLKLTLAFPGAAPSRFAVALRAGSTRRLKEMLDESPEAGRADLDVVAGAAKLLELVAALSTHDAATRGHSERVRAYTELIAEELSLDQPAREALRWGGLIHDIGKLQVPAEILNKTTPLTAEEWTVIRRHPTHGAALAEPMSAWLGEWVTAVADHHERWEGGGYPRGVDGAEISLAGRIVAVADAFDVMTSARSYKPPCGHDEAREELVRCAGTQFDPIVVEAFLSISVRKIRLVMGPLAALALFRWKMLGATKSITTPAAVAVISGVAAFTAGTSLDPTPRTARFEETPLPRTATSGPSADIIEVDQPVTPPPVAADVVGDETALVGGDRVDLETGSPPLGDEGGSSAGPPSAEPSEPSEPSEDETPTDDSTVLTIDPAAGSVEIEPAGGDPDSSIPILEVAPAGAVLCGQGGVCEPISVPLPLG